MTIEQMKEMMMESEEYMTRVNPQKNGLTILENLKKFYVECSGEGANKRQFREG